MSPHARHKRTVVLFIHDMGPQPATSKGAATRDIILERAYMIAASAGLEGLSIGPLADAVGMSKSGVFAHFGSREDLQLAVLDMAATRFGEHTLIPALAVPRGLARLRTILANWFEWLRRDRGGCVLLTAVSEYDDRPGPLRDRVMAHHQRWQAELARAVLLAVENRRTACRHRCRAARLRTEQHRPRRAARRRSKRSRRRLRARPPHVRAPARLLPPPQA